MDWTANYITAPFLSRGRTLNGIDCWGLVRLIYANELGITLPSYGEISANDLRNVALNISAGKDGEEWIEVKAHERHEFDICVMKFYGSSHIGHVGVVTPNKSIIHVEAGIDVCIVPPDLWTMRERVACYRRHKLTAKF